ncbi:hypothetical protein Tco_1164093 [Tanacetum coccineum]
MITTSSRTGSKKPSGLILPPMETKDQPIELSITVSLTCIMPVERMGHYANRYQSLKQQGQHVNYRRDELNFVHFRISTLETTLEDIQLSSESSSI